jgi:acetoacetate decarboxylase
MPYVVSKHDVRRIVSAGPFLAEFHGAEMLLVRFRTEGAVVADILPPPLRAPNGDAYGLAFVARYPDTNFGLSYCEGAVFVEASYQGELGLHCLAMPVDDDIALFLGREEFGYPKKLADQIALERAGGHVTGSVVRRGTEILRAEGELGSPKEIETSAVIRAEVDLSGAPCLVATSWVVQVLPVREGRRIRRFTEAGSGADHLPATARPAQRKRRRSQTDLLSDRSARRPAGARHRRRLVRRLRQHDAARPNRPPHPPLCVRALRTRTVRYLLTYR